MRRRKYDKIDNEKIEDIRSWLARNDKEACPYPTYPMFHENCPICRDLFPKVPPRPPENHRCPCDVYGVAYVRKVAKQVIEKMGKEDEHEKTGV